MKFFVSMLAAGRMQLRIYDLIGPSRLGMIDAASVQAELDKHPGATTIEVRINSRGGSGFDGLAIYNILKAHPARKEVIVDGVAASAASLIAMAGDSIKMPKNALMMVHEPGVSIDGGKAALEKALSMIDAVTASAADVYAAKTGRPVAEIRDLMAKETWMSGEQAVAAGFADTIDAELSLSAAVADDAAGLFLHAPPETAALIALAAVEAPEPQAVSEDALLRAEKERAQDLVTLANLSGTPKLAVDWIRDGTTLQQARLACRDAICLSRGPTVDLWSDGAGEKPKAEAFTVGSLAIFS